MTEVANRIGQRIHKTFAQTKLENRAAFVGYLPAGFPTREAFLTHATTLLEFADLLAQRRLRQMQMRCGASEVALASGFEKVFELVEFHRG